MLSLVTSCSKGLVQPRDGSAHVGDLTAFGGVYSWVSATDQIDVLSITVRPRKFRHNGLLLVVGDENSLWLLSRYCKEKLLAANWVAVHVPM